MNIRDLDIKARAIAKEYAHLEKELLDVIIEIDRLKAFYKLGFPSLHAYVTEALGLSPGQAYGFINVARKSMEVPMLKQEVANGLSVAKAQKLTPVITQENHEVWLSLAKVKTHRQLEREVSIASPGSRSSERTRYLPLDVGRIEKVKIRSSNPRVEINMSLDEKLMLDLRYVQDLLSQKRKRNLNLEETLKEMTDICLHQLDPVRKAKRQKMKGKLKSDVHSKESMRTAPVEIDSCENSNGETFATAIGSDSRLYTDRAAPSFNKSKTKANMEFAATAISMTMESPTIKFDLSESSTVHPTTKLKGFGSGCKDNQTLTRSSNFYSRGEKMMQPLGNASTLHRRVPLSSLAKHEVQLRDKGQCTHRNEHGERCSQRRFLEIHHLKSVSQGGSNDVENLALLCSGHHKIRHSNDKFDKKDPNWFAPWNEK